MIDKVKALISRDARYKVIIKTVNENPYIELKELNNRLTEMDTAFLESAIELLTSEFILVELSSQAGSTAESRVPKKILMVNPEISDSLENVVNDEQNG